MTAYLAAWKSGGRVAHAMKPDKTPDSLGGLMAMCGTMARIKAYRTPPELFLSFSPARRCKKCTLAIEKWEKFEREGTLEPHG